MWLDSAYLSGTSDGIRVYKIFASRFPVRSFSENKFPELVLVHGAWNSALEIILFGWYSRYRDFPSWSFVLLRKKLQDQEFCLGEVVTFVFCFNLYNVKPLHSPTLQSNKRT